jgi:glycosyltransferase involved in cell wall biosynthesis
VVKFIDPVTQDQLINFYVTCDLLLLFQRSSEGGQTAIPGKFYEYLCTGKPILLMSDGGATDRVLRECHAGYLVKYDDIDAIVHTISLILPQIKSRSSLEIFNRDNLQDYSRSSINNRIINIIKQA